MDVPVWLSWVVASASLATTFLAGRLYVAAWYISVVNQFGWAAIAIGTRQWGLLVSCVAFSIIGMWNLISWTKNPPRPKSRKGVMESIGEMEIQKRFNYYPPDTEEGRVDKSQMHLTCQILYIEMARALDILLPQGREKAVAFTELESSSMWAHKAIEQHAKTN